MASSILLSNPPWHMPTRRRPPTLTSPCRTRTCSNNGCKMEVCAMDPQHIKDPCTRRRQSFLPKDRWWTIRRLRDKIRGHKHLNRPRIQAFKVRSTVNKRLHPISISNKEARAMPVPLPSCRINISIPKSCLRECRLPRRRLSHQLPRILDRRLPHLNRIMAQESILPPMADSLICRVHRT